MEELQLFHKKPRVLFVVKKRLNYGTSYGLVNSATFVVNFLQDSGITVSIVKVNDANEIDREVTNFNPTHVFIEALWVTPEKFKELLSIPRHKKRKWIVRLHSQFAFLANEGMAMKWLSGYQQLELPQLLVAPNNEEVTKDLAWTLKLQTNYLPNVYCPDSTPDEEIPEKEEGIINIGCFGALRPMKNHLTQAVAAINFANYEGLACRFHVNATRMEQGGDNVIKNLRALFDAQEEHHELVEHDWLSHYDFVNLVRTMDLGIQVSLTETFDIVAADFVANGIPLIGCKEITWLPQIFQAEPNSTTNMMNKLDFAWSFPGCNLQWMERAGLKLFNRKSKKLWLQFLKP